MRNISVYGLDAHNAEMEEDISATLTASAGGSFAHMGGGKVLIVRSTKNRSEVFDAQRRHNYDPLGDTCETVTAKYGTGGGQCADSSNYASVISTGAGWYVQTEDLAGTFRAEEGGDPSTIVVIGKHI